MENDIRKAIFIGGWEYPAMEAAQAERQKSPAVICMGLPLVKAFISVYDAPPPPPEIITMRLSKGPILWDELLGALTFSAYYWSYARRDYALVRLRAVKHPFLNGMQVFSLVGFSEADRSHEAFKSIPMSLDTLLAVHEEAERTQTFALVMEHGVANFEDVKAFEGFAAAAIEDLYICGAGGAKGSKTYPVWIPKPKYLSMH
jgi:hypothetical protein